MTNTTGPTVQATGTYYIEEVFPDGRESLCWEQDYDDGAYPPASVVSGEAFAEIHKLRRDGGHYRLYRTSTHLIFEVKAVDITNAEDFTMAQRLAKLAQIAEGAARRTAEERLMPAKGVANLVLEALNRIEELERELKEQRTENQ